MSLPLPPLANPAGAANNIVSFVRSSPLPTAGVPKVVSTGLKLPANAPKKAIALVRKVDTPKVPGIPFSSLQLLDPLAACELGLGPCAGHRGQKGEYKFTGGQSVNVWYNLTCTGTVDFQKKPNRTVSSTGVRTVEWRGTFRGKLEAINSAGIEVKPPMYLGASSTDIVLSLTCNGTNNAAKAYLHSVTGGDTLSRYDYYNIYLMDFVATAVRTDGLPDTGGNPPAIAFTPLAPSGTTAIPETAPPSTVPDTAPATVPVRIPDPDEGNEIKPFRRPPAPVEPEPAEEPKSPPTTEPEPEPEPPPEEEENPDPPPKPTRVPVPSTPNEEPLEEPTHEPTPKPEYEPVPLPLPELDPEPPPAPTPVPGRTPDRSEEDTEEPEVPEEPKSPPVPDGEPNEEAPPDDDPTKTPDSPPAIDPPRSPVPERPNEPASPPPTTEPPTAPPETPIITTTPPPTTGTPPVTEPPTQTSSPPPPTSPPPTVSPPGTPEDPIPPLVPPPVTEPPVTGTPPTNQPLPTPKNPPYTPPPPPMGCSACEQAIQSSVDDVKKDTDDVKEKTKKVDKKTDDILLKLDALLDATQTLQLQEVLDRLGPKMQGGLSGFLTDKFAKLWNSRVIDRALALFTAATTVHNAIMLSRNVGETLKAAVINVMELIGIKDADDKIYSFEEAIGDAIENVIKAIVGAENYNTLTSNWAKANRIYQAASNIVNIVTDSMFGLAEAAELIGKYTGKIGNALKASGKVLENSYDWMSEKFNAKTGRMGKFQKVIDGLNTAEEVASDLEEITSELREVSENIDEIKGEQENIAKELEDKETEKETEKQAAKDASQSPEIPPEDMVKPESTP